MGRKDAVLRYDKVSFRGVDEKGRFLGFMRMEAKDGSVRVRGITLPALIVPRTGIVKLATDMMFFYGTFNELKPYFRRDVPSNLNDEKFKDKDYDIDDCDLAHRPEGYLAIPLEELSLGNPRRELIQRMLAEAEEVFPRAVGRLEHVVVEEEEKWVKLSMGLVKYPGELLRRAKQKNGFYRELGIKPSENVLIELPEVKVQKVSVSKLPGWIKEYVKRFS